MVFFNSDIKANSDCYEPVGAYVTIAAPIQGKHGPLYVQCQLNH